MDTWQLFAVGLVMLLGLLGVLTPGVPGPLVVWSGVFWWSMTERTALAWWVLMGATALLLLDQPLKWLLPRRRYKEAAAPLRTVFLAGVSAIGGFFVIPVLGGPLGFVVGLYAAERMRLGGHGEAMTSVRITMRAIGYAVMIELFLCLIVVGAWVGAVVVP